MADLAPQRTRAILLARKLTLTVGERHELAEWIVDHSGSWSRLPEPKARRLADAMDSFIAIQYLLGLRNQRVEERLPPTVSHR